MASKFGLFLTCYMVYVHLTGFLPCRIDFEALQYRPSRAWTVYSVLYIVAFIGNQLRGLYDLFVLYQFVDWRDITVLTISVSYTSIIVITTAILGHHILNYGRFYAIIGRYLELIRTVRQFRLTPAMTNDRNRLIWRFVFKATYFELMSVLLLAAHATVPDNPTAGMDFEQKLNLWVINIMTTIYFGAFNVLIYLFRLLNVRIQGFRRDLIEKGNKGRRTIRTDFVNTRVLEFEPVVLGLIK